MFNVDLGVCEGDMEYMGFHTNKWKEVTTDIFIFGHVYLPR